MCLGLVFYSDLFPFLLTTKLILCTPGHKVVTPWNPLLTEVGRQPRTLPAWTPSYFKHSKSYPKTKNFPFSRINGFISMMVKIMEVWKEEYWASARPVPHATCHHATILPQALSKMGDLMNDLSNISQDLLHERPSNALDTGNKSRFGRVWLHVPFIHHVYIIVLWTLLRVKSCAIIIMLKQQALQKTAKWDLCHPVHARPRTSHAYFS